MKKICEQCQTTFIVNEKLKRSREKRFCTRKCSGLNNGLNNEGRKFSNDINKTKGLSGCLNYFYGKPLSQELLNRNKKKIALTRLKKVKRCNLTETERDVLDGILVSDGCLTSKSSISARLTLGFKYSETLNDIKEALPSIIFSKTFTSKDGKGFHNKSKMYGDLLHENERWYINGNKIIPFNIRINSVSCYWWFICDGYNSNNNVYLCTDSYTKNENLWLIDRFNDLGFNCNITSKNRIRFFKGDSKKFLKWITPKDGIHQQYKYKWIFK